MSELSAVMPRTRPNTPSKGGSASGKATPEPEPNPELLPKPLAEDLDNITVDREEFIHEAEVEMEQLHQRTTPQEVGTKPKTAQGPNPSLRKSPRRSTTRNDILTTNLWAQDAARTEYAKRKNPLNWRETLDSVDNLIDMTTPTPTPGASRRNSIGRNSCGGSLSNYVVQDCPREISADNALVAPTYSDPMSRTIPIDLNRFPDGDGFIYGTTNTMISAVTKLYDGNKRTPKDDEMLREIIDSLKKVNFPKFKNQAMANQLRGQRDFEILHNLSNDWYNEVPKMFYGKNDPPKSQDRTKMLMDIYKRIKESFPSVLTVSTSKEEFFAFFMELASKTRLHELRAFETFEILNWKCDHELKQYLRGIFSSKRESYEETIHGFMVLYGKPMMKESMIVKFNNKKITRKNFRQDVQELRRLSVSAYQGDTEEQINRSVGEKLMGFVSDHINRLVAREKQKRQLLKENGLNIHDDFTGDAFFEFVICTVESVAVNPSVPILRVEEEAILRLQQQQISATVDFNEATYVPDVATLTEVANPKANAHQSHQSQREEDEGRQKQKQYRKPGKGKGRYSKNSNDKPTNDYDEIIHLNQKQKLEEAGNSLASYYPLSGNFADIIRRIYTAGQKVYPSLRAPRFDADQKPTNTMAGDKYILNTGPIPNKVFNRRKKNFYFTVDVLKYFANHCWKCGSATCNPQSRHCPYAQKDSTFKPCGRCNRGLHKDRDCMRAE